MVTAGLADRKVFIWVSGNKQLPIVPVFTSLKQRFKRLALGGMLPGIFLH